MENWVCVVFCFFLFMLGFANPGVSTADDLAYRRHELLEILTSARIPESDIDSLGDHRRLSACHRRPVQVHLQLSNTVVACFVAATVTGGHTHK